MDKARQSMHTGMGKHDPFGQSISVQVEGTYSGEATHQRPRSRKGF